MKIYFFCLSALLLACSSRQHAIINNEVSREVMFYNVENLFDTINDPSRLDDDFTPTGKYGWNSGRYHKKLQSLAKVISAVDSQLPVLVGLCEIENRSVLEDLVKTGSLSSAEYGIVHADSPDERGIDVALLYEPRNVRIISTEFIPVILADPDDPNTRDILYVSAELYGQRIHVIVNHWPSRSGGQVESEPNRLQAAGIVRQKIESVLSGDKDASILVMGDFNDHPSDRSIVEVLGGGTESGSLLYNMMKTLDASGDGTYYYKEEWGALDQIMVTRNMLNVEQAITTSPGDVRIIKSDFLFFTDGKGVKRPDRTYAGEDYKGGYSDHLPVSQKLTIRTR